MTTLILHIDEAPELPDGFAQSLTREGYELLQTGDPEEAIQILEARKPSLVLMELELRSCDGPDLLAGIRDPERGDVPVLVVTRAPRHSPLHGEAIALGAADFLTMPVLASELMDSIRELAPPPPKPERRQTKRRAPVTEISGSLADEPLPELLGRLHQRGASGVLIARCGKARVALQLRNGTPVSIDPSRSGTAEAEPHPESELYQAFGWTDGTYRFVENRRLKSDTELEITRDPSSLILVGILEASPGERVIDWLAKRAARHPSMTAEAAADLEFLQLTSSQLQRLKSAGENLGALLESGLFEERLLYGLGVIGKLTLHEAPAPETRAATRDPAPDLESADPQPEVGEQAPTQQAAPAEEAEDSGDPDLAERALDAERWFRKGEALLQQKKYEKAGEAFGMATHLDPNEGDYLSHLGYALYLSNPHDGVVQREAMEHIANGIKRSPQRALAHIYLGRILRAKGDGATAQKVFKRALQIDPDCHAAHQELRLLEIRKEKSKGLLSRLLRR